MKSVELAIKAGRLRQSPITGLIHHCYEDPDRSQDVIPMYENFCFALALFRTKMMENVLEAKNILERLFSFRTEEGFPIYLHEYPQVKSRRLAYKLSIVSQFILKDFSSILGDLLRAKLESLILPFKEPEDEVEFLIQSQLKGDDPMPALKWWDSKSLAFTGPQKQNQGEPAVTLYDLILGEWGKKISARALKDHPIHLQASLIYPREIPLPEVSQKWSRRFWGNESLTHSALLHVQGSFTEQEDVIYVDLPEKEVQDEVEIGYFINRSQGAQFFVSDQRSTTFQFEEPITIRSGGLEFKMTFSLTEGEGKFWGHLHLGNRPGQIGCKGSYKYEAFDRSILLRTIQRRQPTRIKIAFQLISEL